MPNPMVGGNCRGDKSDSKRGRRMRFDLSRRKWVTQELYSFRPLFGGGKSPSPVSRGDVLVYGFANTKVPNP